MTLPYAREEGLLWEEVGDELIVYDQQRDRAHCLEPYRDAHLAQL